MDLDKSIATTPPPSPPTMESLRATLRGGPIGTPTGGRPLDAVEVQRQPKIDFREKMTEGDSHDLTIFFSEVEDADNLVSIAFAAGQEEVSLTVELSAPGFTIEGRRSAPMVVKR